jgi:hypothetical protein
MSRFQRPMLFKMIEERRAINRGIPPRDELEDPEIADVFRKVLREVEVADSMFRNPASKLALQTCLKKGWLHSDRRIDPNDQFVDIVTYRFPSRLHWLFLESRLLPQNDITIFSNTTEGYFG